MNRLRLSLSIGIAIGLVATLGSTASADGPGFHARLSGLSEVPAVSTTGHGEFAAEFDHRRGVLHYKLAYRGMEGDVTQAHIHFGRAGTNGGVSAFLCSNLGISTDGPPACPASPGRVGGTIGPDDVVGPAGQGIAPGEFRELLRAISAGASYINVHTTVFPPGEIRGQVRGRPRLDVLDAIK